MYWSVIYHDYRPWTWERGAMRQEPLFNECRICFGIDSSLVYAACEISIDRHCWQHTEVSVPFECDFLGDNLSLWWPTMRPIARAGIDPRFIKKDDLIGIPVCQLAKPSISKLWGPLGCLLCQLQLENPPENMPFCVRYPSSSISCLLDFVISECHSDCESHLHTHSTVHQGPP